MTTDYKIKDLARRVCEICKELYPEEWSGKYSGSQEILRSWLNEKTGLVECQVGNKERALSAWLSRLEEIKAGN